MILEIFYDTTCPFCIKRAEWIKRNDPDKRILLSDVNRDMFMLKLFGVNSDDALQDVHAVYRNGKVIKGADVVRATNEKLIANFTGPTSGRYSVDVTLPQDSFGDQILYADTIIKAFTYDSGNDRGEVQVFPKIERLTDTTFRVYTNEKFDIRFVYV